MKGKAKRIFLLLVLALSAKVCWSQDFALKTNALYWAATTPNLGIEAALSDRFTLDIGAAYNPWTFCDDKKIRFWLVQPAMTATLQAVALPTGMTGFFPRTGTLRRR